MKGVGSIRRAILRGGLRLRGGTVMASAAVEEEGEAKRVVSWLDVVEEDWIAVAALLEVEAGENANDEETASEAMTAAE